MYKLFKEKMTQKQLIEALVTSSQVWFPKNLEMKPSELRIQVQGLLYTLMFQLPQEIETDLGLIYGCFLPQKKQLIQEQSVSLNVKDHALLIKQWLVFHFMMECAVLKNKSIDPNQILIDSLEIIKKCHIQYGNKTSSEKLIFLTKNNLILGKNTNMELILFVSDKDTLSMDLIKTLVDCTHGTTEQRIMTSVEIIKKASDKMTKTDKQLLSQELAGEKCTFLTPKLQEIQLLLKPNLEKPFLEFLVSTSKKNNFKLGKAAVRYVSGHSYPI